MIGRMSQACSSSCKPFPHSPCVPPACSVCPCFLASSRFYGLILCTCLRPTPTLCTSLYPLSLSKTLLLYLSRLSPYYQVFFSYQIISVILQRYYSSILSKTLFDPMNPSIFYHKSVPLYSKTPQNNCFYFSPHFLSSNTFLKTNQVFPSQLH